jgi:hypothetical protein
MKKHIENEISKRSEQLFCNTCGKKHLCYRCTQGTIKETLDKIQNNCT